IRIVQPMQGALGYAACAIASIAGLTPALRPTKKDPAGYELVVIGTPVWFWSLSSPVRSWLARHRPKHRVAFFCTMGGSGARRVFATVATLALTDAQIDGGADDRIAAFAQSLRAPRRAGRVTGARRTRTSKHAAAAA
ncbi:MAG: hypothetical protein N2544_18010, partial [Burkholderiales bacterium]|nr:hypothetical protein [Burkholderiales bacterium]